MNAHAIGPSRPQPFFHPRQIALIGASEEGKSVLNPSALQKFGYVAGLQRTSRVHQFKHKHNKPRNDYSGFFTVFPPSPGPPPLRAHHGCPVGTPLRERDTCPGRWCQGARGRGRKKEVRGIFGTMVPKIPRFPLLGVGDLN